jgi:hypothetical protein
MNHVFVNWKTSVAGAVLMVVGLLSSMFDIHIPGFTMDGGAAIATGLGLLMAKDGNVTGGTIKQ